MSRKQLKDMFKTLPNKTPEQVDAFNKFYGETKNDAYKSFETEDEFNTYVNSKVTDATKPLKDKISATELKPKMEEAKKAFIDGGHKESMWKYIKAKSMKDEDGSMSFNDKATKKEFWTKKVSELDDKENYLSGTKTEIPKKTFTRTSQRSADSEETKSEDNPRKIYF